MLSKRYLPSILVVLYSCATLQFVRFYTVSTTFYLNLPAYLSGQERLPFQKRILPAVLMRLFYHSPLLRYTTNHVKGAFTPERAPFYIISLISMVVAGLYVQHLYALLSDSKSLSALVYPMFLFTMMWTYLIHPEANFSYPYDFLSVAFFSAGLYYVYSKRYLPLLVTIFLGTFNRETTLFLIGLYLLDAASLPSNSTVLRLQERFSLSRVPWARAALLFLAWLIVELLLKHIFRHNDSSEDYERFGENIGRLKPRLWPALLNVCGYTLPIVLLLRRSLAPRRFRNYLWILVLWFAVMFYKGVIVETRIYGELCPYMAIALVLILERSVAVDYAARREPDAATLPTLRRAA